MAIKSPDPVGIQDPSVLRNIERTTEQSLVLSQGKPTAIDNETIFPSALASVSGNTVAITQSADSGDIVTLTTDSNVYVSTVNQTINNYKAVNGVAQIVAGNNISITSTGAGGTGVVTINSTGGGNGGNTFTSITMTDTPSGPSNIIQYGLGNLIVWNDGGWCIGEFNGTTGGTEGVRIDPAIEGPTGASFPGSINAATQPTYIYNTAGGNIELDAGNNKTWTFDGSGYITMPMITKLNSGGIGNTNCAEFGTEVYSNGTAITNSEVYMGAGTAEVRAIVNNNGNSLMYLGVENPGFAGTVAVDPGVTSEYAIQVGANGEIQIGAVVGPITTNEYVAGIGVLNGTGNINGLFANGNVAVLGVGDQGFIFDSNGNITTPGSAGDITMSGGNINGANVITANTIIGNIWTTVPASNTAPGTAGQIAYDSTGNLYVCVSTDTWALFTGTTSW